MQIDVTYRDLAVRQLVGFVFAGVLKVSKQYRLDAHHGNAAALSVTPSNGGRACGIELGI